MPQRIFIHIDKSRFISNSTLLQKRMRTHGRHDMNEVIRFGDFLFWLQVLEYRLSWCQLCQVMLECQVDMMTAGYFCERLAVFGHSE